MDNTLYWLWLQSRVGTGFEISGIIDHFGSVKAVFDSDENELRACPCLTHRNAVKTKLLNKNFSECEEIISTCKKYKIHILTPDGEFYPKQLLSIKNYPAVLFVRGDVTVLKKEPAFSVIGSRSPSKYGEEAATEIVSGLVREADALIVSGGALGIDSVAHRTALNAGGKTVLVMGCGHGTNYLSENSELRKSVFQNGALVTEYPPYAQVTAKTFPERNRIVSALSKAVVIIEAASRSGTFSTARHAARQGRELFVLPGDIVSGNFDGSNRLLSEGAKPVFSCTDILSYYYPNKYQRIQVLQKDGNPFPKIDEESDFGKKARRKNKKETDFTQTEEKREEIKENIKKIAPESISKNAEIVYNIMSDGATSLDEIARASALETGKVLASLTELELEGIISTDGPNKFKII